MASSSVIGALRVNLGLDSAQFQKGIGGAQKGLSRVGKSMQSAGRTMTAGLSLPIVAFGAMTLRAAGNFEASMNRVRAVSGATGDEFEALRDQAKELGATTQFSASEAADGMGFLAQAGFEANEIIGAMPGTLQLASAAQIELADAADIVSNVLTGYGKDVSELAHVNDVLVATFTKTNTDLVQLGEAMKYAGPVAASAGVKFEVAAAAIGLMGNAGIQAGMAGTSLRGAISRLLDPAKKAAQALNDAGIQALDASGRLRPLDEILEQLAPHAEDTALFMKVFGQRAGPAMAALVDQGADALRDLTAELEQSGGTAERIANVQMEGFNGAMKALASAFEALMISIADSGLLEFVTDLVQGLAEIVRGIGETSPELLKLGVLFAVTAAAIGPALIGLGLMASALAAITWPIAAGAAIIAGFAAIGVAILANGNALDAWRDAWAARLDEVGAAMDVWRDRHLTALGDVGNGMDEWRDRMHAGLSDVIERANAFGGEIIAAFASVPASMAQIGSDIIGGLWNGISEKWESVKGGIADIGAGIAQQVRDVMGVKSPSTVMHEVGVNIMEGLALGISDGASSVKVSGGLGTMLDPFKDALKEGKLSFRTFSDAMLEMGKNLASRLIDEAFKPLEDAIMKAFGAATSGAEGGGGIFGAVARAFGFGGGGFSSVSSMPTASTPGVNLLPGFASGGVGSGLAMVGERGREIVNLGASSRVFSNADTEKMLKGGNEASLTMNIDARGSTMSEGQWRRIAREEVQRGNAALVEAHREYPVFR